LRVGVNHPQPALVSALECLQKLMRLLVQPSRVDREHIEFGQVWPDEVGQHHRLGAQGIWVGEPPVPAQRLAKLAARRGGGLFELGGARFSHDGPHYSETRFAGRTKDCF
jgi:hypothetical protein